MKLITLTTLFLSLVACAHQEQKLTNDDTVSVHRVRVQADSVELGAPIAMDRATEFCVSAQKHAVFMDQDDFPTAETPATNHVATAAGGSIWVYGDAVEVRYKCEDSDNQSGIQSLVALKF